MFRRFALPFLIVMSVISRISLAFRLPRSQQLRSLVNKKKTGLNNNLNFYSTPEEEIKQLFKTWSQPAFRYGQVKKWVYDKGVLDFEKMDDLPLDLRQMLTATFSLGSLKLIEEQISKDGTRKRAYELQDGQIIESVLMPYTDGRQTACISSQAGCGMGCVFCATGQMGFSRQLSSAEIFEQAQRFSAELRSDKTGEKRLSNVVMMGMGEPLANYENVIAAVRRMNTELGIGAVHIF
jgi:23S rRNA (adenine2503-C2)-methyltransferase